MKALSLWQPWASFIAVGAKTIETRGWETHYRGPIAIHATAKFPRDAWSDCMSDPFYSILNEYKLRVDTMPLGAIIAVCKIQECYSTAYEGIMAELMSERKPYERALGNYAVGRFAWVLGDVKQLKTPIPCRGFQRIWNLPADVLAKVADQVSRWEMLDEQTASGKQLFKCRVCGRESTTPDKKCYTMTVDKGCNEAWEKSLAVGSV